MTVSIDYTNMFLPGAVTDADWEFATGRFRAAHGAVMARVARGDLGFVDLPEDAALLRQSTDFAQRAGDRWEDVVILGIGGSALGPIALRTALRPHAWNTLSREERGGKPRLTVLDNVDPETIAAVMSRLDLERAL